ncbi:hypothetical protein C8R44DRAFT_729148 [Mycena epipterygia]|nr:hypothetical protein C8R44DRAFT_729148 [Mycena epipterygia]
MALGTTTQILCVPSTDLFLYQEDNNVYIKDWNSGDSLTVGIDFTHGPTTAGKLLLTRRMWIFWVASINTFHSELQLFKMEEKQPRNLAPLTYMTTIKFSHAVNDVSLSGEWLSVIGHELIHGMYRKEYLHSLRITFNPKLRIQERSGMEILKTWSMLSAHSVATLDKDNFLVLVEKGAMIFHLPSAPGEKGNLRWSCEFVPIHGPYPRSLINIETDPSSGRKSAVFAIEEEDNLYYLPNIAPEQTKSAVFMIY